MWAYYIHWLDVQFSHLSLDSGKLSVFHIFAQWVSKFKNVSNLWYQLKFTIKGFNVDIGTFFKFRYSFGRNVEHDQLFRKKNVQISGPNKEVCNMLK